MDLKIKATQTIDIHGHDSQKFYQSKGNRQGVFKNQLNGYSSMILS